MSLVGNLADLPLTDIFQIVTLSKRTGILRLSAAESNKKASVTFLEGNIIQASSTEDRVTLGALLKEKGLITSSEETAALAIRQKTKEPLEVVLVREKIVPQEKIEPLLIEHIQGVILGLLKWNEGRFEFELLSSSEEASFPQRSELVLPHGIDTQHLIIEGLRLLDEEKHQDTACEPEKKSPIGFASLLEEGSPVSLSESAAPAPLEEKTGHPDGLWESIQEEMDETESNSASPLREGPLAAPPLEDANSIREQGSLETRRREASPPFPSVVRPKALDFLEELMREMGDDIKLPQNEPVQKEISSLKSMVEELKTPNSLSEVLLLILRFAADFLGRAALFVVREDEIRGFGQFGLEGGDHKANDRIRDLIIPTNEESIFTDAIDRQIRVLERLDTAKHWNRLLLDNLGGEPPEQSVVLPVSSNHETIALLYGDNGTGQEPIGDIEALEIFIIQAGMVLDRSHLERKLQDIMRS